VERERRELVRGGMATEPKREEVGTTGGGGGSYIDGRGFWETRGGKARRCAGRARAPGPGRGCLLPFAEMGFRFVLGSRGLCGSSKPLAPLPPRWTAELKLRAMFSWRRGQ
jgi:hypothetical protein